MITIVLLSIAIPVVINLIYLPLLKRNPKYQLVYENSIKNLKRNFTMQCLFMFCIFLVYYFGIFKALS